MSPVVQHSEEQVPRFWQGDRVLLTRTWSRSGLPDLSRASGSKTHHWLAEADVTTVSRQLLLALLTT